MKDKCWYVADVQMTYWWPPLQDSFHFSTSCLVLDMYFLQVNPTQCFIYELPVRELYIALYWADRAHKLCCVPMNANNPH